MSKTFEASVAFMQLFLLALWEGLGAIYFGWSAFAVFLVWLVGIWTLNIATATVLRTYLKLVQPQELEPPIAGDHPTPDFTDELEDTGV